MKKKKDVLSSYRLYLILEEEHYFLMLSYLLKAHGKRDTGSSANLKCPREDKTFGLQCFSISTQDNHLLHVKTKQTNKLIYSNYVIYFSLQILVQAVTNKVKYTITYSLDIIVPQK